MEARHTQRAWLATAAVLAACLASQAGERPLVRLEEDFFIELPEERGPLPQPLTQGQEPGFSLRGTKAVSYTHLRAHET